MKPIFLLLPFAIAFTSTIVVADCSNDPLLTDAGTSLSGNRIDATAAAGSDSWNEVHQGTASGGNLCEVAQGSGHPVDPSRVVGTWTPSGSSVTYNYGTGGSYTFALRSTTATPGIGATIYYCNGGTLVASGTLKTSVACP